MDSFNENINVILIENASEKTKSFTKKIAG